MKNNAEALSVACFNSLFEMQTDRHALRLGGDNVSILYLRCTLRPPDMGVPATVSFNSLFEMQVHLRNFARYSQSHRDFRFNSLFEMHCMALAPRMYNTFSVFQFSI